MRGFSQIMVGRKGWILVIPPVWFSPINVQSGLHGGACRVGGADGPGHLGRDRTYPWANAYKCFTERQWTVLTEVVGAQVD